MLVVPAEATIRGWFVTMALLLALSLPFAGAHAKDNDAVDYVALAALLTRDGEYQRAEQALANVDPAVEGVDLVKYHTVRGLLAQQESRWQDAADAFAAAATAGEVDPQLHLYRAQALFQLQKYREALAAVADAGPAAEALSGPWIMRAHAHWMLGERQQAMDLLAEAGRRFPDNPSFQRRQLFYLVDAGLYAEAAEVGRSYLARSAGKPDDYAAIGTALRRARQFDQALGFLEEARLKYPGNGTIVRALAQTWLERGDPLAAADVLAPQAEREPELLVEAAELYRRAGQRQRALALNARVPDPAQKLKQRVGLLVEGKRYDEVIGMQDALARAGLFADQDIRYALAYAFYRAGDFAAAERQLSALTRPDLFRRATELRRLMADCGKDRWSCA